MRWKLVTLGIAQLGMQKREMYLIEFYQSCDVKFKFLLLH